MQKQRENQILNFELKKLCEVSQQQNSWLIITNQLDVSCIIAKTLENWINNRRRGCQRAWIRLVKSRLAILQNRKIHEATLRRVVYNRTY